MQDFTPQDWGQMGLMAGLSILSNNDGRMNNGQLLARGGLDALAGLKFRKQYEQAMARQAEQDAIARQKHDIEVRKGQMELGEAARRNEWIGPNLFGRGFTHGIVNLYSKRLFLMRRLWKYSSSSIITGTPWRFCLNRKFSPMRWWIPLFRMPKTNLRHFYGNISRRWQKNVF